MITPQVLLFSLERLASGEWWEHLTAAELGHAQTLSGRHLVRFVNGRIALRIASRDFPGSGSEAVSITRDNYGRLSLGAGHTLYVSLAYGARLGVAALARQPIGIDYESDPAPVFWASAARRYCCACEQHWLAARPEQQREEAFVWLWTRREAVLKYLGIGIRGECRCLCALGPDTAQLSFRPTSGEGIGTLVCGEPLDTLQPRVIDLGLPGTDALSLNWLAAPATKSG